MKRGALQFLIILGVALMFFGLFNMAFGAESGQLVGDTQSQSFSISSPYLRFYYRLTFTTPLIVSTSTTVKFKVKYNAGSNPNINGPGFHINNCGYYFVTWAPEPGASYTYDNSTGIVEWTISPTSTLATCYAGGIGTVQFTFGNNLSNIWGTTATSSDYSSTWWNNTIGIATPDAYIANPYFSVSGPDLPEIALETPLNGSTIADFGYWTTLFTYPEANPPADIGQIRIRYGTSTAFGFTDIENAFLFPDPTRYYMGKTTALDPGTYYAQANMMTSSSLILATSSIVSFNIIPVGFVASPTSTDPNATSTCDNASGLFSTGLCYMNYYLFTPSQESVSRFQSIKNDISLKPPMGYFPLIASAINTLSASGSSTLIFPDLSGLDTVIFDPIKQGIGWLLFFLFLFWAFNRFRHIEL